MSGQQLPPYGGLPPAPGFGGYPGTAPYRVGTSSRRPRLFWSRVCLRQAPPSYYQALQPWGTPPDSFRAYGAPPEHTGNFEGAGKGADGRQTGTECTAYLSVYAVEPNRGAGRGALRSLLSACSGLLCCCCLCDLLTRCL
ncbi:uncharacterized protein LOC144068268 isoform X1 [Stigmatopora argus]